nr:vegetative cell wall protein gp1-like [Aegilops tauschii subsp. strangulata]
MAAPTTSPATPGEDNASTEASPRYFSRICSRPSPRSASFPWRLRPLPQLTGPPSWVRPVDLIHELQLAPTPFILAVAASLSLASSPASSVRCDRPAATKLPPAIVCPTVRLPSRLLSCYLSRTTAIIRVDDRSRGLRSPRPPTPHTAPEHSRARERHIVAVLPAPHRVCLALRPRSACTHARAHGLCPLAPFYLLLLLDRIDTPQRRPLQRCSAADDLRCRRLQPLPASNPPAAPRSPPVAAAPGFCCCAPPLAPPLQPRLSAGRLGHHCTWPSPPLPPCRRPGDHRRPRPRPSPFGRAPTPARPAPVRPYGPLP